MELSHITNPLQLSAQNSPLKRCNIAMVYLPIISTKGYIMGVISFWRIIAMHFPKRLVTLRKAQGYTQQSLADAVGMHVNQIKKYESGTAQPTLSALIKLAQVLHVS